VTDGTTNFLNGVNFTRVVNECLRQILCFDQIRAQHSETVEFKRDQQMLRIFKCSILQSLNNKSTWVGKDSRTWFYSV